MNALRLPSNDQERMHILNSIYVKGLSTPKHELAFSAHLLGYLKPFISKLNESLTREDSTVNLNLIRQVVDELIADIYAEIEAASIRLGGKRGAHLVADYGLQSAFNPFEADFYYSQRVA
jgi:hypothetical protein